MTWLIGTHNGANGPNIALRLTKHQNRWEDEHGRWARFPLWSLIVLLVLVVTYGIAIYNALVSLKHKFATAWSNIEVLLKQRHDELPKLVAGCKQYMGYERETL